MILIKQVGTIIMDATQIGCWFVGGGKIHLKSDGSYALEDTSLTTCESGRGIWEIKIKKGTYMSATSSPQEMPKLDF